MILSTELGGVMFGLPLCWLVSLSAFPSEIAWPPTRDSTTRSLERYIQGLLRCAYLSTFQKGRATSLADVTTAIHSIHTADFLEPFP